MSIRARNQKLVNNVDEDAVADGDDDKDADDGWR